MYLRSDTKQSFNTIPGCVYDIVKDKETAEELKMLKKDEAVELSLPVTGVVGPDVEPEFETRTGRKLAEVYVDTEHVADVIEI